MKTKPQTIDIPQVGMGCTMYWYTDRSACTIERISASGKTMWIREDTAKRTDTNGMCDSQSYEYSPNPNGVLYRATLRQDGDWRVTGRRGQRIGLGYRRAYRDFSF